VKSAKLPVSEEFDLRCEEGKVYIPKYSKRKDAKSRSRARRNGYKACVAKNNEGADCNRCVNLRASICKGKSFGRVMGKDWSYCSGAADRCPKAKENVVKIDTTIKEITVKMKTSKANVATLKSLARKEKSALDKKKFAKKAKTYKSYKNCKTFKKRSTAKTYRRCIAAYKKDSVAFNKANGEYRAAVTENKKEIASWKKSSRDMSGAKKSVRSACRPCSRCLE